MKTEIESENKNIKCHIIKADLSNQVTFMHIQVFTDFQIYFVQNYIRPDS